jgi:hypothetical protein
VCADDALLSDLGVVENRSAHADKASIADRTSMNDRAVSDGNIFADEDRGHAVACVCEDVFLQVGAAAYPNALDVSTKHRVEKY